jgi:serine/threonine protein kinase
MGEQGLQRLGDFEIIREIGRGGMGVVYEARQVSLNRKVALKLLSNAMGLTPKAVQRFHREAEAAAKLHHTNIVPVYATGEVDGTYFYAMELIDGPSLDRVIRQLRAGADEALDNLKLSSEADSISGLVQTGPYVESSTDTNATGELSSSSLGSNSGHFDTVARMVAEVADALEYAHQLGVIHRDIKPSNLLLSSVGRLSVNDFGLARLLEQPGLTMTGEFVGTPAYMSPEQITAGRAPLDHRTDIYSLGATLYELLTLSRPFSGERRDQVIAQIMHKEPKAPRKVNRKVPVDLETICLKAMEKDPDKRYQSARALAEDLRRYLNRFAISARRAGPIERSRKWAKRHPGLCAGLACALLAIIVASYFAFQAYRSEEQRHAEIEHLQQQELAEKRQNALDKALLVAMTGDMAEAERVIIEAEKMGASTGQVRMLRGQVALHGGNYQQAVQHLEQAVELLPQNVAAMSMLATAYSEISHWQKYSATMREADRLSPRTPEDYLFLGHALSQVWDYERGLELMEEAFRRRPSLVARLLLADARTQKASDLTDVKKAEKYLVNAVQDVDPLKRLLPGNSMVLWTSFYANHSLALVYDETQQQEKRDQAWAKAKEDVRSLEPLDAVPDACFADWTVLRHQGKVESILDRLRQVSERPGQNVVAVSCALTMYRSKRFAETLAVLDKRRGFQLADQFRPLVLAELDGNTRRAVVACEELNAGEIDTAFLRHIAVLRVLGETSKANALDIELGKKLDLIPPRWQAFTRRILDYSAGKLSAEELLRSSAPSRVQLCTAHYLIAIELLSSGNRKKAREHFEQALLTRADGWAVWDYSWVFKGRMADDPDWPRWLPAKK